VGLALIATSAGAPPAAAVSQRKATLAALKALKPAQPEIVFGLPKPLSGTQRVGVTLLPGQKPTTVPKLGRRTWLFWGDEACDAQFPHSSRLVLIDDRTGRVRSSQELIEEPTIDGVVPPFLATPAAYASSRYRVVSSNLCVAPGKSRGAGTPAGWKSALPPGSLDKDCMVIVGDQSPMWQPDYQAMSGWADDVGLRHTTAAASMAGLRNAVADFAGDTAKPCTDVLVFIAGHGVPPPDTTIRETWTTRKTTKAQGGPPAIVVHYRPSDRTPGWLVPDAIITPDALVALVDTYAGKVDFKFKIASCFSGRFEHPLSDRPNVRIVEMSSAADQTSVFHMTNAVARDTSGSFYPPDKHDRTTGVPLWRPEHLVNNKTTNPLGADEFTNGNVAGFYAWSQDPGKTVDLGGGVSEAAHGGQDQNFGAISGYTTVVITPLKAAHSAPAGAAFQLFTHSGWAHDDPSPPDGGLSTVCVNVSTVPAQAGTAVSADMTTGPGIATHHVDGTLSASGAAHLRFDITAPGHYDGTVTVGSVSTPFSVDVPAPTGSSPDHGGDAASTCP